MNAKILSVLCLILLSLVSARGQQGIRIATASAQNGVFVNTSMAKNRMVIELKNGHFRLWSEALNTSPVSGDYVIAGNSITLNTTAVANAQWTFQKVNDTIALCTPHALAHYMSTKDIDIDEILLLKKETAEDAWSKRHVVGKAS